jgi:hypothetical protein
MPKRSEPLTQDFADWLLTRRADIQRLMVDLYFFSKSNCQLQEHEPDRLIYGHLVAIAFSLWRAAFLADRRRDWTSTFEGLHAALDKLIRDNSFLFPDEKNSGSWTVTYYLQNARLRLLHAQRHLKESHIRPDYTNLASQIHEEFGENARDTWDTLLLATKFLFTHLQSVCPGH